MPPTRSPLPLLSQLTGWRLTWLTCFDPASLLRMAALTEPSVVVVDLDLVGGDAGLAELTDELRDACGCPILLVDGLGGVAEARPGGSLVHNGRSAAGPGTDTRSPAGAAVATGLPGEPDGDPGSAHGSGMGADLATGSGPRSGSGMGADLATGSGPRSGSGMGADPAAGPGPGAGSNPEADLPDGLAGGQSELRWLSLRLDRRNRSAYLQGRLLPLSDLQFRLLWTLCHAGGEVVQFADLSRAVYGDQGSADRGRLQAHVRRIRLLVEFDPLRPTLLLTVWGRGFRMAAQEPAGSEWATPTRAEEIL
ncbi:winged helix-turn-helix domain-containing protein [Plantactinospora siamensis]|uniref:Winged helix-turn-helix domain-containing protein n=1 Tax=Plantactinospora siamensis TaxID=555372 RepID=A0ABV6NZY8_9ACTN